MRRVIQVLVVMLAVGAVFQAVGAYALQTSPPVVTDDGETVDQCADLRGRLRAFIWSERMALELAVMADENPEFRMKLERMLEELATISGIGEPGP